MDPAVAFLLLLLLFTFQATSADSPTATHAELDPKGVGHSVNLPVVVPKGTTFSGLKLRSLGPPSKAVAMWEQGKPLTVLDPRYSERVSFLEEEPAFQIQNLTLEDGGSYEVSMFTPEGSTMLNRYTLFVFHINITGERLANSSCNLNLLCEAGAGAKARVAYSWKNTKTGDTASDNARLHLTLSAKSKDDSYTCSAQALGTLKAWEVFPYASCPTSAAAGLSAASLFFYHVARAVLAPAIIAVFMLL
ncbi:SLAM family member 9 isoform X2 [Zootoca vivipara]|uniref:SLAM family member 9 isoform X2 n=1 Tax=Zootoca vivipara TaxID=8524 RepID=UPI001590F519|nr:SLAM family member 9 isoform X2 [Zootoca vivipara]